MKDVRSVLTIAGTDPSGGAGIQADLKTFQELETYGMSVITSVVAQNTTGVQAVEHMPLSMLEAQLESVFSDMPVHACKTGMIATVEMLELVKTYLEKYQTAYVADPVMVATSGDKLIDDQARNYLREHVLPLSTLVTPNIPEASYLTEIDIETYDDMKKAAKMIVHDFGAGAALVKGGHLTGEAKDFLYDGNEFHEYTAERIHTKNTHGTGCTYAAAITAYLGQGKDLYEAVALGKRFVTEAIRHSIDFGAGSGPTNHFAIRRLEKVGD